MSDSAALPTYRLDGGVAVITLDDGKANVFSHATLEVLEGLLDRVGTDGARALVLVGRPGRFSAGFDLSEMTAGAEAMRALVERGVRWWLRLYGLGVPTVAACTGHALAGGAVTLLACDVRLGADVPAKIGLNEVAIGMPLPQAIVELARDRLARRHFTAAALCSTIYDPAGAVEVGYLDRTVAADHLLAEATAEAARLGELRTGAFARTKTAARGSMIETCLAGVTADLSGIEGPRP